MYNKKAQGEIITTVLIILLVLAAVVIVWQVVKSTVTTGTEQIGTGLDCATISLEIKSITAQSATGVADGSIKIRRDIGSGDLQAITIISNGASLGEKTITNLKSELGEDTISNINITADKEVSIAAMVGSSKNLCEISDTETAGASGTPKKF
ncbi:MAG: hypothetical protein AABW67_00110 [Nanoarchaeota archaeon]